VAKCVKCGAETILFVRGQPVCPDCDEEPELKRKPAAEELPEKNQPGKVA